MLGLAKELEDVANPQGSASSVINAERQINLDIEPWDSIFHVNILPKKMKEIILDSRTIEIEGSPFLKGKLYYKIESRYYQCEDGTLSDAFEHFTPIELQGEYILPWQVSASMEQSWVEGKTLVEVVCGLPVIGPKERGLNQAEKLHFILVCLSAYKKGFPNLMQTLHQITGRRVEA